MQAKIKLEHVGVWGVDTHARAASLKQFFIRRQIQPVRIPILQEVNFEANHGDRVAVIGMNGSGKSSLLKVISGNYPIHQGVREVSGVVAPLIEMGAGFDAEISARRNIKLTYALRGKLRDYSKRVEDEIIAFAELGDKIDLPLKTYSSGMCARLAFSSAIFQDPDILLLDEIFATGDAGFIEKSRALLKKKVENVSIAIMVDHAMSDLLAMCNRAVVMHQGRIVAEGSVSDMAHYYRSEILKLDGKQSA